MGAQESKSSDSDDYFVAAYETRTVLVRRVEASYYDNLLSILHKRFLIPKASIIIQTNELPISNGKYVEIPDDTWAEVCPRIRNIKVVSHTPAPAYVSGKKYGLPDYDTEPRYLPMP